MIKINLLPHKKIKQVDKAVMKLRAIVMGIIVLTVLGVIYGTAHIYLKKSALKKRSADTKQKLDVLKKKATEAEGYEKSRLEVQQKLKTIQELDKRRIPMTPLLNGINVAMTQNVWLTSLSAKGPEFSIEGIASDSKKNAQIFADALQALPTFSNVKMGDIKDISTSKEDRYSFKLTGKLAGYADLPPETAATPAPAPAPAKKPAPKKK